MRIHRGDPRYEQVVKKQFNKRFTASPDYVRLASNTEEIAQALADAVAEGKRLVVTSGGHCLEGFVSDPTVEVILDVSPMKRIYLEDGAVVVEAGATVGETFAATYNNWGTVIPLGEYPGIGIGGHVCGGAFGFLCREHGLAADYLYAVEVVTVDEHSKVRTTIATRELSDPNRELWWAHTGGGGGNFGIVSRYWFRSLPSAPKSITTFYAEWDWNQLDQTGFQRLLQNHGDWSERNSGPDSAQNSFWALAEVHRKQFGKIIMRGLSTSADTTTQIDAYLDAMSEGVQPAPVRKEPETMSWLDFALNPFPELFTMPPGGVCTKAKDALLRRRLTDRQIDIAYHYLTSNDYDAMGGMLGFATYGGRVNAIAEDATASAHRNSILDMAVNAGWLDPKDEAVNLAWTRDFYESLLAETGGAPVRGEAYDGALINHPDTDLADPARNTSGVPWHDLYYHASYSRLQRVKAVYDPLGTFRHALSIRYS